MYLNRPLSVNFITLYLCITAVAGLMSTTCNFDHKGSPCFYLKQSPHNDLDWEQGCGRVDPDSGPTRGYNSPCFFYVDADGAPGSTPKHSRFEISPNFDGTHQLKFSYNMYGKNLGILSVYKTLQKGGGKPVLLWKSSSDTTALDQWITKTFTLNSPMDRIVFEVKTGGPYKGIIAIDSLKIQRIIYTKSRYNFTYQPEVSVSAYYGNKKELTLHSKAKLTKLPPPGSTSSKKRESFSCSFKGRKLCGIKQLTTDNFNWLIYDGYICAAGPGQGQGGAKGKIELPVREDGSYTLSFQIAASKEAINYGDLLVLQNKHVKWKGSGKFPAVGIWKKVSIPITISNRQPIILEAKVVWKNERIALKDLQLKPN